MFIKKSRLIYVVSSSVDQFCALCCVPSTNFTEITGNAGELDNIVRAAWTNSPAADFTKGDSRTDIATADTDMVCTTHLFDPGGASWTSRYIFTSNHQFTVVASIHPSTLDAEGYIDYALSDNQTCEFVSLNHIQLV